MKADEILQNREDMLANMDRRRALFGLFFAFGNKLQATGDSFYEEITCKQFFLLVCLGLFQDENPTLGQLAALMGSSHQNVKQLAGRLEKAGYVRFIPDGEDKRKTRVMPAPRIQEFAERYQKKEEVFLEGLFSGLEEQEIEETYQVLLHLEKNLEEWNDRQNK